MMCVWTKVLIMTLLLLNSLVAAGRDSPEHFMEQMKLECHFVNGTEHVQFVWRLIYNRQEILRFDSHVGKFVALTELGRPIAELMNSLLEALEQARAQVARCKDNYRLLKSFWMQRKGKPEVTVYPSKMAPLGYPNQLVCFVTGFYPGDIEVKWFLNGQEEIAGVVSTGLISNGDWTFQILVMLEMIPKHGDVYTCQVEHSSLQNPVIVVWEAQSRSAQGKMLSGVGGLVLGLIFLVAGLTVHLRSQKGFEAK
ncbi:DLA class II histocompatibility antigen, DR-1 beta chain-like isoform X1 [Trichosurus vulpecula]|uniref:DLA class II histocompatibility antigen, DR-1 beta chain-like isoform X1 n=1 Tax=Trichosurus vulpecula TaxID=9337 RepID=UPI00186AF9A9|nr:DLA class II histocompatibility antigen, DR-1 beta chain-like isoform X1 [Trichosurus vulpecula]